jgi:hypothetical protein
MAAKKKRTHKANSFAGIPRMVMQSDDYKNLSGNAVKLLLALCYQYWGHSNGNLTTAWSIMHEQYGFKSQDTVNRAKLQLLKAGMIIQTRTPKFLNPGGQCALYALTWKNIDDCPGRRLEIKPTKKAWRDFTDEKSK